MLSRVSGKELNSFRDRTGQNRHKHRDQLINNRVGRQGWRIAAISGR